MRISLDITLSEPQISLIFIDKEFQGSSKCACHIYTVSTCKLLTYLLKDFLVKVSVDRKLFDRVNFIIRKQLYFKCVVIF